MDSSMNISALASSLTTQAAMGMLITKVLDQTQQMIQQQAAMTIQQAQITPVSVEGLGENIDLKA